MKKNSHYTIFLLSAILLISCNSNKEIKIDEKQKQLELKKNQIIDNVVSKYGISYNFNTIDVDDYKYSIDFNTIINSNFQLIEDFKLHDIYEKDNVKYISISSIFPSQIHCILAINQEQEDEIKSQTQDVILVVKMSTIKKLNLSLNGQIEDNEITSLDFESDDFSQDILCNGKLIEIVSVK